jgi:hypothetical protein
MSKVLSFDKWNKLNEQSTPTKSVSKGGTASGSSTPMRGGSSTGTTTRPANSTKPAGESPIDIAMFISDNIVATFNNPQYWAEFKSTLNDDEVGALKKFNGFWSSFVQPKLAKLSSTDRNAQTLIRLLPSIQAALEGGTTNDSVSWKIVGTNGMSKDYTVDTDF